VVWIAAYFAVLLAGCLLAAVRSEPTVLGGSSFLLFNAAFAAVSLTVPLLSGQAVGHAVSPATTTFWALLLLGSWITRSSWLIIRAGSGEVREVVETCLVKVRIAFEKSQCGFTVAAGPTSVARAVKLRIRIRDLPPSCALIRFQGRARHRKLVLLKHLLAKQFRGVLPHLRVRTR
jgi:hypothetical protein